MPITRTLQDPILLFLHTFSPKSACVEGPRPHIPLWEILDPPLISVPNMKFLCFYPVVRRGVQTLTTHDGQSMIVQGSLVDRPSEPKM